MGNCGKDPEVALLQDLLVYNLKGLAFVAREARKTGITDPEVAHLITEGLFSVVTNVDFDAQRFEELIERTVALRESLKKKLEKSEIVLKNHRGAIAFVPPANREELIVEAKKISSNPFPKVDGDILSLQHLLLFGMEGMAAYAHHARILGQEDEAIYAFLEEGLSALLNQDLHFNGWLDLVLKCGEVNLRTMELLDRANTGNYGHPVPTRVPLGVKKGKAILVSGHDLKDLEELLKQTEGKGISIYTHGEMLPAHGYPGLKKYPHLYGHYGTAWQNQAKEFAEFPGAILMTTNCLQKPLSSYRANLFTAGPVGCPGVTHIRERNFKPLIERALELPGFTEDREEGEVMVGFGHHTLLNIANQIIAAVKNKEIRHFFLVAGCDGARPGRNYYTEFVEKTPDDTVVLTLACGKFRFFNKELGEINGIPRLLDLGQCNDAYSAIKVALALAEALGVSVNDLPLSLVLSWFEQKAVAILLSLLYLGIKNIRLGPTLPAFISPNILNFLVKSFNIMPINTAEKDLKAILGEKVPLLQRETLLEARLEK